MANLIYSGFSPSLDKCFQYTAIVPENKTPDTKNLLLLHGLSDDHTVWSRYSSIERYANERGICVIMPDGGRSFYEDMAKGGAFYSSIINDVMESAQKLFSLSTKRENNFTAGLSMGGYGAFKIAMRNPDKFAGCASLSGALNIAKLSRSKAWDKDFSLIWGDSYSTAVPGSDSDLFHLVDSFADTGKPKPKLCVICGDEDFLLDDNREFFAHVSGKGFDCTYEEHPGNHNWRFWDTHIAHAIDVICEL